ncbi:fungalysin/thermolysin propeptide [Micromonospora pisi]|uniref:Fungalysin/thermolysin propeptide n=1 Tax=Micromonospora pisi TaxID=589240 RepID=A0A495JUD8_9ACTN|nr:M36 family metallopeptidase [Micromonospora pisi]RKR92158.1 fungalysin/thermolysin propeptide [Micromonospora pisi]
MPVTSPTSRLRQHAAFLLVTTLVAVLTPTLAPPAWAAPDDTSGDSAQAGRNALFLTGPNEGKPETIAIDYLRTNPARYGVSDADLSDLVVSSRTTSQQSGVTHVNLSQRYQELEVFGATATVSVASDGSVIFVGHSLLPALAAKPSGSAVLDATGAVKAAADALDLPEPTSPRVLDDATGRAQRTVVSGSGISDEPIPARLGWQRTDDGLRLAWQLVIDDSTDSHLWNATVDSASGELLNVDDWTVHDAPEQLADTLGRHTAPTSGGSGHGTVVGPQFPPRRVDDGSSYRVFTFPKNDPNEGPRTLVTNPADATASPYGWHDTDGVAGPESSATEGNNVRAYADRDANNQPDPGSVPDGGAGLDFNFPANLDEQPQTYTAAAVANLFYWCNIVHDLTYRYGFDEAGGNFQVNNYERGGVGGDDVRCEAQDGSGQNNANFSTPAQDGGAPRMQMFLWPGNQFGLPNAVTIGSGSGASTYQAEYARFTPAPTNAGFAGQVVPVDDGVETPGDGCTAYTLPAGAIALLDRSSACTYYTQVVNAEAAGAVAVVVANNVEGAPAVMNGSVNPPVGIPAVMVSQADGATIRAGLPASGRVHRNTDRPAMRDAAFRSETIFHEYGHGVSNRLTGGPTVNCLTGQEQMGEGWSDFLAIVSLINPDLDDPEGPRGYGQYAQFADSRSGDGFRPRPYSRNMEIQPFTYDSIKTGAWLDGTSLAAPHGIGHGWAAVLWDMTWDLIDRHGLNRNAYGDWRTGGNNLAMQLVIDGLKIQGCGPGFVVGRDAIIAADAALTGGENNCTLWASFARRGLGYSAVQGTTGRDDNSAAYDTHPSCERGFTNRTAKPALNSVKAGSTTPMQFVLGRHRGDRDILASNSPYSRLVDCQTLATVNPDGTITPGPLPVKAETPGRSKLSASGHGRYTYPWKTDRSWAGTCREFVLSLEDGTQHRAYFQFR